MSSNGQQTPEFAAEIPRDQGPGYGDPASMTPDEALRADWVAARRDHPVRT